MPANPETIQRSFLQTFDVPGTGFETRIAKAGLAANRTSGRQIHPGIEAGYVLQGSVTILVDGQPPLALTAGQSWQLPPRAAHDVQTGPDGAQVIVTWVVEKGAPFETPAG